jgi:DNA polymerase-3 subunit beta
MKAQCDRATLTEGVQAALGVVPHRSPKPTLGCIKVEAAPGAVTLLATDLEVGIRVNLTKVDVQEPGTCLVPAERFHAILRELEVETVAVSSGDRETEIVAPGARFKVLGEDPADFPNVPAFPEAGALTILADDLAGMIKRTLFATARENTRYALNGVLWEVEGTNLTLVATDGRRLSHVKGKCKGGGEKGQSAIVPSKAMQLIERCLATSGDAKATLRVAIGEKDLLVESPQADGNRWTIYSRLVDGHFPKYDDVVPKDCDRRATLSTAVFHAAVRKAALLTNEESRGVHLKFSPEELVLTSSTPEMGEAEVRIAVSYEGEPLDIGFNPVFLIDALKAMDAEQFTFAFKGPNKPGVMTEDKSFTYVIMPVSIV